MTKTKLKDFVQKYTMILILILVLAFFAWRTDGKILMPQNITNIIAQNAYVFVLAAGMLLCILTGAAVIGCGLLAQAINERIDPRLRESGGLGDAG